ncbi:unnamed protein product [Choristocarpus tenellus]
MAPSLPSKYPPPLNRKMSQHGALYVPKYGGAKEDNEKKHASKKRMVPSLPSKHPPPLNRKHSLLPDIVFSGNIQYIQTHSEADRASKALLAAQPHALGFDLEWVVSFVPGEPPRRTATLQLCAPERPADKEESNVWGTAFIFHLSHMICNPPLASKDPRGLAMKIPPFLPESLVQVLVDPSILLPGVNVRGDIARLEREYVQLREKGGIDGATDLSEMARLKVTRDRRKHRGTWSMVDLCAEVLCRNLPKPIEIRRSNWEKRPLSVDQLCYAATDAFVGLHLLQVLESMPNLVVAPCDSPCTVTSLSMSEGTGAVASGFLTGVGDSMAGDGSKTVDFNGGSTFGRAASGCRCAGSAGQRKRVTRLLPAKIEVHHLWHGKGLSMESIAKARGVKLNTVREYLADCIEVGLPFRWDRLGIDSEMESLIVQALHSVVNNEKMATRASESGQLIPETSKAIEGVLSVETVLVVDEDAAGKNRHSMENAVTTKLSEETLTKTTPGGNQCCKNYMPVEDSHAIQPFVNDVSKCVVVGRGVDGCVISSWNGREEGKGSKGVMQDLGMVEGGGRREQGNSTGTEESRVTDGVGLGHDCGELVSRYGLHVKDMVHECSSGVLAAVGEAVDPGQVEYKHLWKYVRLKAIKQRLPERVEYWMIKTVLARLKSLWQGTLCCCDGSGNCCDDDVSEETR